MSFLGEALALLPGGAPSTPIDLDRALDGLGVDLRYERSRMFFNGATDFSGPRPQVELAWISPRRSPSKIPWQSSTYLRQTPPHLYDARTRFTLAHEIGHVLLHRLSSTSPLPERLDARATERVCDQLAAHMLMPTSWFRAQVQPACDLRAARAAAARAGTSLSATVHRARTLGYGIAGLFGSVGPEGDWSVDRSYGVRLGREVSLCSESVLEMRRQDLKAIVPAQLRMVCGVHTHVCQGQVRRSGRQWFFLVDQIDGCNVPAARWWSCPINVADHRTRG